MTNAGSKKTLARWAYKIFHALRRAYWHLTGGRREVVFGEHFRFEPTTHFPSFRGLTLPQDEIFSTIVRYGDYVQTHSAYLYLKELTTPPVVVDIGAHHGIYAILLGKLVQQKMGTVLAVEPNPRSFKILQRNVRRNNLEKTVKCENVAIMDAAGTFRFVDNEDQSRIVGSSEECGFEAKTLPLSLLLEKYSLSAVDVMIIDVEGAELNVLQSIAWGEVRIKRIYCELHPYNWKHFGYSGKDMTDFLTKHKFRCFDMYLREHKEFNVEVYLGPALFVSKEEH